MAHNNNSFDPLVDYYPPTLQAKYKIDVAEDDTKSNDANINTADIGWTPDFAKFEQRTAERQNSPTLQNSLPKGWPKEVQHPLAWTGSDLQPQDYVHYLTPDEINEVNVALSRFKKLDLELSDIQKSTFPLPTLGVRLQTLRTNVYDGIGFCIVRGLDSKSYSREDNAIIYLGVSSYFGEQRGRQYQDGRLMTHVTDVRFANVSDNQRRPLFTNEAQPFHADLLCGILAFYFLGTAAEGGNMLLASSWKVYNDIASKRPDLIGQLSSDDWVHDTFGRIPSYHRRALLHYWKEKLVLIFSRRNLTGSVVTPRSPNIPPMTEAQAEALDAVHFTAAANCVSIKPEVGDMAFMNNFAILHSRSSFKDSAESKRYILRLWLNNPDLCWDVPPGLRVGWDRIFSEVDEISNFWEIDPYESHEGTLYDKVKYGDGENRGRTLGHDGEADQAEKNVRNYGGGRSSSCG